MPSAWLLGLPPRWRRVAPRRPCSIGSRRPSPASGPGFRGDRVQPRLAISQATACGGSRGAGLVLSLKLVAACLGTAGGAAVGLATGVFPAGTGSPEPGHNSARVERRRSRPQQRAAGGGECSGWRQERPGGFLRPGGAGRRSGQPRGHAALGDGRRTGGPAAPGRAHECGPSGGPPSRRPRPDGGPRPKRGGHGPGSRESRFSGDLEAVGITSAARGGAGESNRRPPADLPEQHRPRALTEARRSAEICPARAPPENANRPTVGAVGGEERVLLLPARYVCRQFFPGPAASPRRPGLSD